MPCEACLNERHCGDCGCCPVPVPISSAASLEAKKCDRCDGGENCAECTFCELREVKK